LSFEIYNQFQSVIDGSLKKRIQQSLETKQNLNKPEANFEEIIKSGVAFSFKCKGLFVKSPGKG
jgi:hypothetical protein